MNAWSHLPNAEHIDTILADAMARPEVWAGAFVIPFGTPWSLAQDTAWGTACRTAWIAAQDAVRRAAWIAAQDAVRRAAWLAVWQEVRDTVWAAAQSALWDAIRTLIAWDESAALLDLTPDALRTIIDVADGDVKHQAALLLPAVIARRTP